jgi:hypothetical protein
MLRPGPGHRAGRDGRRPDRTRQRSPLRQTQDHRRARLRPDQTQPGLPPIHPTRPGRSRQRMETDLHHSEPAQDPPPPDSGHRATPPATQLHSHPEAHQRLPHLHATASDLGKRNSPTPNHDHSEDAYRKSWSAFCPTVCATNALLVRCSGCIAGSISHSASMCATCASVTANQSSGTVPALAGLARDRVGLTGYRSGDLSRRRDS